MALPLRALLPSAEVALEALLNQQHRTKAHDERRDCSVRRSSQKDPLKSEEPHGHL